MFRIKNKFKEWYEPHESFVMRNPLFPIEVFFDWKSISDNAALSKESLRKSLRSFYLQPMAQEALYIGSPDLHEQLMLWLENKIEKPDKQERIELSLVKYMIRASSRCTPYGLFASCTWGCISDHTNVTLEESHTIQRHGRLDMDYVCEVQTFLLKQKEIREQLLFYPNTSIYPLGNQLRYIEHRFAEKTGRSYHLVQIEKSDYIDTILFAAKNGCTTQNLAALITDDEITSEEAQEFIFELIVNQVLVSELEPNVTGEEYFSSLVRKLKKLQHTEKYVEVFEKVVEELGNIKSLNETNKNKFYFQLVEHLQQLDITLHPKTLIQVDSYRPASICKLNKKIYDELLYGASLLQLMTTNNGLKDSFSDFKNAFSKRYESQWIPLVEVLDTESGIGYGKFANSNMEDSPLIDNLTIGNGLPANNTPQSDDTEAFIWQLYQEAIMQNKIEISIDDKIIEQLSKKEVAPEGLPDSICMMFKINASSAEEIDYGNYRILLQSPSGPSGGNLLGRFCHLHSEIENLTQNILINEEAHHPECIYAEIVHLPESRIGNVLMRPVLRKFEIPYLCGSTLSKESQIPITDLMVSIVNNQVILQSKSLRKQVIPRMTNAHNFSMTTLPIYQFLCDLQHQQTRHIGWNWGILNNCPFLPRVSYGRFIISKARWILTKEDVKDFDKKNDDEVLLQFSVLAKTKDLPEYITLSQGDNELTLHIKNIFCIRLLLNELSKGESILLTETFELPEQCWINGPNGHYTGEFIAAFHKKIPEKSSNQMMNTHETGMKNNSSYEIKKAVPDDLGQTITFSEERKEVQIERYFSIGSEWVYAKIYCGTKTAEKILCDVLKPFTEELLSEKIIDQYFYLRYHDDGHHIRIRFHNAIQPDFWKEVVYRLQNMLQPYMQNHTVSNLQFETYQREIERYGIEKMVLSEAVFYHQSVAILNFLPMLYDDEGEHYRWQVALKAIDLFLNDFKYTIEQKCNLIKTLRKGFLEEFKIKPPEQKKITERFNNNKKRIENLMGNGWKEDENLNNGIEVFKIKNTDYLNTIEAILTLTSAHQDLEQINNLMSSYLHMFINRMFISNQRKIELVIYDYLLKYYESKIAIEKYKKTKPDLEKVKV